MAEPQPHRPALFLMAAFSRYNEALQWARRRAEENWGPVVLESPHFDFHETDYYAPSMGPDLKKVFFAHQRLADPADLSRWKRESNCWEEQYARHSQHAEPRPLNLDPGYLTLAKLVLASTKDHAHRIYLRDGIYAEVTLHYQDRRWQRRPWTFPDYRRADYHAFFDRCRDYLRRQLREESGA